MTTIDFIPVKLVARVNAILAESGFVRKEKENPRIFCSQIRLPRNLIESTYDFQFDFGEHKFYTSLIEDEPDLKRRNSVKSIWKLTRARMQLDSGGWRKMAPRQRRSALTERTTMTTTTTITGLVHWTPILLLFLLSISQGAVLRDESSSRHEDAARRAESIADSADIISAIEAARRQVEALEERRSHIRDAFLRRSMAEIVDDGVAKEEGADRRSAVLSLAEKLADLDTAQVVLMVTNDSLDTHESIQSMNLTTYY